METAHQGGVNKDVFTTPEVAWICKVAARTVNRWFDSGRLPGHRQGGPRGKRMVRREDLVRFLTEHGMPLGELGEQEPQGSG
jgi:hypothetical protein